MEAEIIALYSITKASHYSSFDNDIAAVRMATAADLTLSTVGTVCMATHRIGDLQEMMTSGWGGVNGNNQQSTFLKHVRNNSDQVAITSLKILVHLPLPTGHRAYSGKN